MVKMCMSAASTAGKSIFGDWMKYDWTVSAQYYGDWMTGSDAAIDRDKYEHSATLNVSRTFSGGNFEIGVSGVVGLNYLDSFIQPKIDYAFTDNIKFSLSAMLYNQDWSEKGNYGKSDSSENSIFIVSPLFKSSCFNT